MRHKTNCILHLPFDCPSTCRKGDLLELIAHPPGAIHYPHPPTLLGNSELAGSIGDYGNWRWRCEVQGVGGRSLGGSLFVGVSLGVWAGSGSGGGDGGALHHSQLHPPLSSPLIHLHQPHSLTPTYSASWQLTPLHPPATPTGHPPEAPPTPWSPIKVVLRGERW